MRAFFGVSMLALALAVAGCGGGGGGGPLPASPKGGGQYGSAAFVFTIPKAGTAAALLSRHTYKPNTIPSNTQSVVVTGMNADGTSLDPVEQTIVNASACTPSTNGLQCSATINLPMGIPLILSIVAYDQANGQGVPLANAQVTLTVVSGMTSISASLGTVEQYYAEDVNGGMSLATFDHGAGTMNTQDLGTGNGINGSLSSLPNGWDKIIVNSSTSGTPAGSVAYVKESPLGGLIFVQAGPSPQPDGSGTTDVGWGAGTGSQGQCPTSGGSVAYNGVAMLGGGYVATSGTAYTTGTATIAAGASPSLTFVGSNYTISGSVASSAGGTTPGCSNGVYGSATGGYVATGIENVVVVADPSPDPVTNNNVGEIGFAAPSASYSLSALSSVSYDVIRGGQAVVNGAPYPYEYPGFMTPIGANQLSGCDYLNFEANQIGTTCTTLTLQSEPLPGIVTGIANTPTGSTQFVAAFGVVNGKYMASAVSVTGTQGVNILLMQH